MSYLFILKQVFSQKNSDKKWRPTNNAICIAQELPKSYSSMHNGTGMSGRTVDKLHRGIM
jgi:hypothetical protein